MSLLQWLDFGHICFLSHSYVQFHYHVFNFLHHRQWILDYFLMNCSIMSILKSAACNFEKDPLWWTWTCDWRKQSDLCRGTYREHVNKEEPTVWANTVSHVYVQIFYVEHLAKASRRRRLRLVRTIPGHLMRTSRRRSMSLEIRKLEAKVTIQNPIRKTVANAT